MADAAIIYILTKRVTIQRVPLTKCYYIYFDSGVKSALHCFVILYMVFVRKLGILFIAPLSAMNLSVQIVH